MRYIYTLELQLNTQIKKLLNTKKDRQKNKNNRNCISIFIIFYEFDPKTYMHTLHYLKYVNTQYLYTIIHLYAFSFSRFTQKKKYFLQLTHIIIAYMTELIQIYYKYI